MQVSGEKMRELASMIQKEVPGKGFMLLTFEFTDPSTTETSLMNYVSNAERRDMLRAMMELMEKMIDSDIDPPTPNYN